MPRPRPNPNLCWGLLLVFLVAGCTSSAPPTRGTRSATALPTVRVAAVREGSLGSSQFYSGDVRSKDQVSLMAKLPGRIERLLVEVGSRVEAGELLVVLDHSALEAHVRQAEAALAQARARLASLEAGARSEAVAQAEANLSIAEARLAALLAGPTAHQLEEAEAAVRLAKNQLYAVQSQGDAYLGNPMVARGIIIYDRDMKEAQSGVAWEQVKIAEARLAQLMAPPTSEQLQQAQAAVDAARAQLELARAPFTQQDLEVSRAQVAQAEAALELARSQLEEAYLKAPFSGIISEKFLSEGALAGPAAPILSLVSSEVEVSISVEEGRIAQLSLGDSLTITVAAYPGILFPGSVSSIAPTLDPRTRTFTLKAAPQDEEGRLKPGMFARIEVGLAALKGLLVPKEAALKRGEETVVFVLVQGTVRERRIESSTSDERYLLVTRGLNVGEEVVVQGQEHLQEGDQVRVER